MVDFTQKINKPEVDDLINKQANLEKPGKELPKLDVGTPVLHEKIPDSTKIKHLQWSKGTIKNCENPRKYHILTDESELSLDQSVTLKLI